MSDAKMDPLSSNSGSDVLKVLCQIKSTLSKHPGREKKLAEDGTVERLVAHLLSKWRAEGFVSCADVAHSILANCLIDTDIRLKCIKLNILPSLLWWLEFEKSTCSLLFRVSRCLTNIAGYEIDDQSEPPPSTEGGSEPSKAHSADVSKQCLKAVTEQISLADITRKLLAQHTGHRRCIFGLCKVLAVLFKYAQWSRSRIKADKNVFAALVAGLSLKSLDVIKSALCCVETCTSLDVGFAKGLAEAGGIPIVVQLAEHSHSKVRQRAVLTLVHCLWEASCRFAFGGCQGMRVLLHHMQSAGHDSRRRAALVKAIAVCCQDVICRESAKEVGVLKVLLDMLAEKRFSSLHQTILRCLLNFYFDEASLTYMVTRLPLVAILAKRVLEFHLRVRGHPTCGIEECFHPHRSRQPSPSGHSEETSYNPENQCVQCAEDKTGEYSTVEAHLSSTMSNAEIGEPENALPSECSEPLSAAGSVAREDEDNQETSDDEKSVSGNSCAPPDLQAGLVAPSGVQDTSDRADEVYSPVLSETSSRFGSQVAVLLDPNHSLSSPASPGSSQFNECAVRESKDRESNSSDESSDCASPLEAVLSSCPSSHYSAHYCSTPGHASEQETCSIDPQPYQVLSLATCPSPVPEHCFEMSPQSACGFSPETGSSSPAYDSPQQEGATSPSGLAQDTESAAKELPPTESMLSGRAEKHSLSSTPSIAEQQRLLEEADEYLQSLQKTHPSMSPPRERSARLFGAGLSKFADCSGSGSPAFQSPSELRHSRGRRGSSFIPPIDIPEDGPLTSPVPVMQRPPPMPQTVPLSPLQLQNEPFGAFSPHVFSSRTIMNQNSPSCNVPADKNECKHDNPTVVSYEEVNAELWLLDRLSQLDDCVVSLGNRLVTQCLVAHLVASEGRCVRPAFRTLFRILSDVRCFEQCLQQQCVFVVDCLRCNSPVCPLATQECRCKLSKSSTVSVVENSSQSGARVLCLMGQLLSRQLFQIGQSSYGRGVIERGLMVNEVSADVAQSYLLGLPIVVRNCMYLRHLLSRAGGMDAYRDLLLAAKKQSPTNSQESMPDISQHMPHSTSSQMNQEDEEHVKSPASDLVATSSFLSDSSHAMSSHSDGKDQVSCLDSFSSPQSLTLLQVYQSLAHLFAHGFSWNAPVDLMSCLAHQVSQKRRHSFSDEQLLGDRKRKRTASVTEGRSAAASIEDGGHELSSSSIATASLPGTESAPSYYHSAPLCTLPCCAALKEVLVCCQVGYYRCRYDMAIAKGNADVVFELANGQLLPAHRSALSQMSEPISAMLFGDFAEAASCARISMEGLSPAAVVVMIHGMYGCELRGSTDDAELHRDLQESAKETAEGYEGKRKESLHHVASEDTEEPQRAMDYASSEQAISDFCVGSGKICWSPAAVHNDALCLLLQTLVTCEQYLVEDMIASCSNAISLHIRKENVAELLLYTSLHNLPQLHSSCLRYLSGLSAHDWLLVLTGMNKNGMIDCVMSLWRHLMQCYPAGEHSGRS